MAQHIKPARIPLSRERIIQEAVALADEQGLEMLSMRKLAQRLNVEAMSLYNHVKNKDDALDGMVDFVIAKVTLPQQQGEWRAEMRKRAVSCHETLIATSLGIQLVVSRVNVGPAMLRYIDATLGCLVNAGFSHEMADRAWNAIDSHVYGFTLQHLNFPLLPEEYASAARQFLPLLPVDTFPHMHALTVLVAGGTYKGQHDFSFGLDLILVGLERLRPLP